MSAGSEFILAALFVAPSPWLCITVVGWFL